MNFKVEVASETDEAGTQTAGISEENLGDNTAIFTLTIGGEALPAGNTASVTVTVSGTATDADFDGMTGADYAEIVAAIQTAATTAGLAVSKVTGDSLTLTWDSTDPNAFSVNLTAFNDTLSDSGQTLTLALGAPSVLAGPTPTLLADVATATITEPQADAKDVPASTGIAFTTKDAEEVTVEVKDSAGKEVEGDLARRQSR